MARNTDFKFRHLDSSHTASPSVAVELATDAVIPEYANNAAAAAAGLAAGAYFVLTATKAVTQVA